MEYPGRRSKLGQHEGMVRAINRQLGDANNYSMQILAIIPDMIILKALDEAQRGNRFFTVIEAQAALMLNAVRKKFGFGPITFTTGGAAVTAQPVTGTGSTPASSMAMGKIKIKLSQVIDQGSDMEIEQLDHHTLQKARRAYVQSEGDNPLEKDQRSACKSDSWFGTIR